MTATDKGLNMTSSADLPKLQAIYEAVDGLEPPKWPADIMGSLDATKLELGAKIYQREALCGMSRQQATVSNDKTE